MRELHLFAGAGGGILGGLLLEHVPIGAVEIDPYCRQVLHQRQADGLLPPFPIHDDVRTFDARPLRGQVDVVCGGFPCQPWSQAGKRLGAADPRHLWPEMARIVAECRPRYVFAENVAIRAFEEPWRDLRGLGYRVPPALCLGAVDVGAPHRRNRWWLLAADSDGNWRRVESKQREWNRPADASDNGAAGDADDAEGERCGQGRTGRAAALRQERDAAREADATDADRPRLEERQSEPRHDGAQLAPDVRTDWWASEPDVGRVAHGVAHRVDRLRAIGNGQVAAVAATAFRLLMAAL